MRVMPPVISIGQAAGVGSVIDKNIQYHQK